MSGMKKASCHKLGLLEGDRAGEVQGQELGPELGAAETRGEAEAS
jgi:hypothetical protein